MATTWQPPLPEMPSSPPARAWARIAPPRGYETQWRRLAEAALELDLGPDELAEGGLEAVASARDWKPATVTLYSKVARYGGLALDLPRTPEPDPAQLDLRPLTEVRGDRLEHLRAVAWCALALSWPATVSQFRDLRREQVTVGRGQHLHVETEDGRWSVGGAWRPWHAWEAARAQYPGIADSPWVLPALRRGPGVNSRVGGQLSTQALQVTFAKHAVRTGAELTGSASAGRRAAAEALSAAYQTLSYDSYRRLALAGGTEPVADRGAVRALRRVKRESAPG